MLAASRGLNLFFRPFVKSAYPASLLSTSNVAQASVDLNSVKKHPGSPYTYFLQKSFPQVKSSNPNSKTADIFKTIAAQWKTLGEAEKQPYVQEFNVQKAAYDKVKANLSESQKQELSKERNQKIKAKKNRAAKQAKEENGYPKRPLTSYIKFSNEFRKSRPAIKNLPEAQQLVKEIAEAWKALPVEKKAEYQQQAAKEQLAYKKEVLNWEKKMEQKGAEGQRILALVKPEPPKPKKAATRKPKKVVKKKPKLAKKKPKLLKKKTAAKKKPVAKKAARAGAAKRKTKAAFASKKK